MYMVQKLELFPTSYEYSIGKYNNLKEMFVRGDVDISGNIAMSGNINCNEINSTSITATSFYGDVSQLTGIITSGGGIENGSNVYFNNVDISNNLKINNIQSMNDISSGLGEIDVSFNNNTLNIDAKNMLYGTKYFNYNSNIDISNLIVTNLKNNAQIVINLDNSGTVLFRGSNNGGINNSKINFVYDISLNNTDSIITLTKLNNNIFLMVSEFK